MHGACRVEMARAWRSGDDDPARRGLDDVVAQRPGHAVERQRAAHQPLHEFQPAHGGLGIGAHDAIALYACVLVHGLHLAHLSPHPLAESGLHRRGPVRCSMHGHGPREEAMKSPDYDYEKEIPAGFYDKIHQRKAGVRYCWHDLKFRAVAAHLTRAKRLLDIGCGPGTFIGNYLGGIDCLGTDFSAAQIQYANRRYARRLASLFDAADREPRRVRGALRRHNHDRAGGASCRG